MTAPLKFALVPVDLTDELRGCMLRGTTEEETLSYAGMLAASPGNDLLLRIVEARDAAGSCQHGTPEWLNAVDELYLVLNELGGGHG